MRDCTKRNVLSCAARIFDPMGFLAPVTLLLKLLIKQSWMAKLDWDETPKSIELLNMWNNLRKELTLLGSFDIPRHLGIFKSSKLSLIGFCDACLDSFGAAVYLRSDTMGSVTVRLICAKTKVAPMKGSTIPRLELCAAYLLAKLLDYIKTTLESRVALDQIWAFSDSTVALCWISSPACRWSIYVSNRVSRIQELVPAEFWYHISGKYNTSDSLSRGLLPSKLIADEDWIIGPHWLREDEASWPVSKVQSSSKIIPEERVVSLFVDKSLKNPLHSLVDRSSSWHRLIHATIYILRFLRLLKTKGGFSVSDQEQAEKTLIKIIQQYHFKSEIDCLNSDRPITSNLRFLCPIMDSDGLLRVGGRLSKSDLTFIQQHPVILPKQDHFVLLLIDRCHNENLHTGPALVFSLLRQKYWIVGARNLIRFRIQKCIRCFRVNPRGTFPRMADLPAVRLSEAKPFLHCGIDYAGPFFVTLSKSRGVKSRKAYLCLFICLCTKALHLELTTDLSTENFLNAFKRFLSRRGACSTIYSDCGSNFIGAKNELNELYTFINSEEYNKNLEEALVQERIVWKLQPPASPHFSGVWESQVKCVKTHLKKVVGNQVLTYEELNTVLIQIEALLNSRPLSWLSTDPSDPQPLTPAHFLTLTPLRQLPAVDILAPSRTLLQRKRLLDQMVQSFWHRWRVEYLHQLQIRQKWYKSSHPIKVGTLVILRVDNVPPLQWPIGIVEEVFPGTDGVVRVVNVRTRNGLYKRPVVRLCPLPID